MTTTVYFDMSIGGEPAGRIEMGLFGGAVFLRHRRPRHQSSLARDLLAPPDARYPRRRKTSARSAPARRALAMPTRRSTA